MPEELYTSGDYLEKNPSWHSEESPWKVKQILRMLRRQRLRPRTICEVGCGAGEILRLLQEKLDPECTFVGYDISPQAIAFCEGKGNERLQYMLGDFTQEQDVFFDLLLVFDVLEHLEDYFQFLRDIKAKSEYKIFHIPLDLSVQTVLRPKGLMHTWDGYGHIHSFTKETALRTLEETGYEIVDHFYTVSSIELPTHLWRRRLLKIPRLILYALQKDIAARTIGGYRLLVLAR